jgi:uncharacterized cupredoxin-like copper-binding protein
MNNSKGENMSRLKLATLMALIGVLLLAACTASQAEQPVNADGSVNVDVTLKDFTIESSLMEFKPGIRYHFVVTNKGQVAHEFMIMPIPEHMGMAGMSMEQYDEMALMMIPIEQLPVGATVETDYTFDKRPEGNIELVCMTPGHFEAGMRTAITIK